MENNKNDIHITINKYFSYLEKNKGFIKSNQNLIDYIKSKDFLKIMKDENSELNLEYFIKIFFIVLKKKPNDLLNFMGYNYKILEYILKKKMKVASLKATTHKNINNYLKNCELYLNVECGNLSQQYVLLFYNFFVEYAFVNIEIFTIFKMLTFLKKYCFNCNSIDLRESAFNLISTILKNISNSIYIKIEEIFKTFFLHNNLSLNKYVDGIKNFYFGVYDLENLISKKVLSGMLNNLFAPNPIPNLNDSFNKLFFPKTISMYESDSLFSITNFNNLDIKNGRFGKCEVCSHPADFYCINYRLPICSLKCKEKIYINESMFTLFYELKQILAQTKCEDSQILFLKEIKVNLESFLFDIILEIQNFNINNFCEYKYPDNLIKIKQYLEIIQKIIKNNYLLLDKISFSKIKNNLIKILIKIIYVTNNNMCTLALETMLIVFKYYGYEILSEIGLVIVEFLKIIENLSFSDIKIKSIVNFFNSLFHLHNEELLYFIFLNYDYKIEKQDLIKKIIQSLFKLLIKENCHEKLKSSCLKLLNKILQKIINFSKNDSKLKYGYVKQDNLVSFATIDENDEVIKTKRKYFYCKQMFNEKPKILNEAINTTNINNFPNDPNNIKFIAKFLKYQSDLDKEKIGEFLAPSLNQEILTEYLAQFNFKNDSIADALRKFLFCYKIVGEAQVIDRIMVKFSDKYYADNRDTDISNYIDSSDAVYYLSFNLMMLNTSLYNQNIKEEERMSFTVFNSSLKSCGKTYDEIYLKGMYDNIKNLKFFISDFAKFSEDKNDTILIDSFNIHMDLCEYSSWVVTKTPTLFYKCLKLIGKDIFDLCLENFETVISCNKNENILLKFLNLVFSPLLEILNLFELKNDKISLIKLWIKLIDFKKITDLEEHHIKILENFENIIIKQSQIFNDDWGHIILFVVNKHLKVEKLLSTSCGSDDIILNKVSKIFSKDLIEKIFRICLNLEKENFINFFSSLLTILIRDLEFNNVLNKFILNETLITISNYRNREEIWDKILIEYAKFAIFILNNYCADENAVLISDSFLYLKNSFLSETEQIIKKYFKFYMEIIFIFFREKKLSKNLVLKIIDILNYKIKRNKVLNKILLESEFIKNLINFIIKGENTSLDNEIMDMINSILFESDVQTLYSGFIFSLIKEIFNLNFQKYFAIFQIFINKYIIYDKNKLVLILNHFCDIFTEHIQSSNQSDITIKNLYFVYDKFIQYILDNRSKEIKNVLKTTCNCIIENYFNLGVEKNSQMLDMFISNFMEKIQFIIDNHHISMDFEIVNLLLNILSLVKSKVLSNFTLYNKLSCFILELSLEVDLENLFNILEKFYEINLSIFISDYNFFKEWKINDNIFLNKDITKISYYLSNCIKNKNIFFRLIKMFSAKLLNSNNDSFSEYKNLNFNDKLTEILKNEFEIYCNFLLYNLEAIPISHENEPLLIKNLNFFLPNFINCVSCNLLCYFNNFNKDKILNSHIRTLIDLLVFLDKNNLMLKIQSDISEYIFIFLFNFLKISTKFNDISFKELMIDFVKLNILDNKKIREKVIEIIIFLNNI